jgi:UTP--glucose-1-phosphate uridylyltransferase
MKYAYSFLDRYKSSLKSISSHIREKVNRQGGLSEERLLGLVLNPTDFSVVDPGFPDERSVRMESEKEKCESAGKNEIDLGKVAYCIMAGGAGTRIGEPKALLKIPGIDMSLLTLKLFQAQGTGPIWIVVSPTLKQKIVDHVKSQAGFDQSRIEFVEQYESYRLTPDNQISFIDESTPNMYPCGHGDLFPALYSSGLLQKFASSGGKYISIVNVDNVMGDLNPSIIGRHILSNAKVSCEVVERREKDSGGVLCEVDGSLQIVEEFRVKGKDAKLFKWLNTNSFVVNADLELGKLGNSWNRVQKNVDGRVLVQHERLLQEITSAYETNYLMINREDRFFPVKNLEDLIEVSKKLDGNLKFR